jgi:hypothetical protein
VTLYWTTVEAFARKITVHCAPSVPLICPGAPLPPMRALLKPPGKPLLAFGSVISLEFGAQRIAGEVKPAPKPVPTPKVLTPAEWAKQESERVQREAELFQRTDFLTQVCGTGYTTPSGKANRRWDG